MNSRPLVAVLIITTLAGIVGTGYFFMESRAYSGALDSAMTELRAKQQALQLATATLRSATATLRTPPVALQLRQSLMGDGLVAMIHSTTDRSIPFRLTVRRPSTGASREFDFVLLGLGEIREIGEAEGWAFMKGDELTFHSKAFDDETFTVP
jgi:hypothetical protein